MKSGFRQGIVRNVCIPTISTPTARDAHRLYQNIAANHSSWPRVLGWLAVNTLHEALDVRCVARLTLHSLFSSPRLRGLARSSPNTLATTFPLIPPSFLVIKALGRAARK